MKVKELRAQIEGYSKKELQSLIAEMYKAVPKRVKDEKQLDQLIQDPEYFKKRRKRPDGQAQTPNIEPLAYEIKTFIDHANKDYYFAPNRVISKKERSKWRFKAKKFYKDLIASYQVPDNRKEAAECMENLYRLFCKASGYYVFVSPEPFEALDIPQETFLEQTLRMKKEIEEPRTWVKNGLRLALDNKDDPSYYKIGLSATFAEMLQTPPLTEIAVAEAKLMKRRKEQHKPKSKRGGFSSEWFAFEGDINNIVEAVFLCQAKLHEWEEAISYWKENHLESDEEIRLFQLLDLLSDYNRIDEWQQEYDNAVQSGVQPRERLQKTYNFLKEHAKFPGFEDISQMYS